MFTAAAAIGVLPILSAFDREFKDFDADVRAADDIIPPYGGGFDTSLTSSQLGVTHALCLFCTDDELFDPKCPSMPTMFTMASFAAVDVGYTAAPPMGSVAAVDEAVKAS